MNVELVPAVLAGLIGGVVMLLVAPVAAALSRAPGFDVLQMWARFLGLDGQRAAGLAVHLAVSAAVASLYALGFRLAGAADAGWAWGLTGSVIHWIVAGVFLGAVPESDQQPAPQVFAMRLGAPAALGFLVAHLAFGVTAGVVYFTLHSAGGLEAAF